MQFSIPLLKICIRDKQERWPICTSFRKKPDSISEEKSFDFPSIPHLNKVSQENRLHQGFELMFRTFLLFTRLNQMLSIINFQEPVYIKLLSSAGENELNEYHKSQLCDVWLCWNWKSVKLVVIPSQFSSCTGTGKVWS